MSKIAVLIGEDFEDIEYIEPAHAFRDAGHTLVHVGSAEGKTVLGKKEETPVVIDTSVSNVDPKDFDALFIPGGYSPDHLRTNTDAVRFVKEFVESGKPVFVICHGPQLLISADVVRDKKITGWKSILLDLKNAGARVEDAEVVQDGNLMSSRGPQDLPAFIHACLEKLRNV